MSNSTQSKYSEAGVDIDKGNAFVEEIKDIVASTHQRGVLGGIGGFSSHIAIDTTKYKKPVIVNSTDGVGTKLAIAHMCNKHDTIGIDLVAMCVNDLIVGGANPLCFLDYFAVGKLDLEIAKDVVKGIAEGCQQARCSLVGGETAEMPGLYRDKDYDLAGFVTGIVDRDTIIDGSDIREGDKIIGLSSSGLHSNGYSLVRKICFTDHQLKVDDFIKELGCTLGEELLRPTKIYVQAVQNVLKHFSINGMVHNTGGGFIDNIPRILPKGCKAIINKGSWPVAPIFPFLQEKGAIPEEEMYRTFNMGIGLMAVVAESDANDICHHFKAVGEEAFVIGEIAHLEEDENATVTII
ncbi:phosphoribosylformylglycinamidine cyclo-ligase [Desulforhopalus singaporensis]|uniref:Phosphoribosylformylglycinamidine cyclo-ligase n=1 Tax=Desulforhopalus singaporensis TaxID=91360 RepID=A0A1H0PUG8_9BACT|nr:phosphoribosylformylglycinamidine cyclo-ligase [Desulforhopalus singaporensis]SDP08781.1 phosphoribosylformylglycinamidine cyclo-ligase [Desulforhopalus singaporensis]